MSDLQIGLLILGLFVIGSVIAFNWFQEKQFRRRAEHGFERPEADVLLGSEESHVHSARDEREERIDPHLEPRFKDTLPDDEPDEVQPVQTASRSAHGESVPEGKSLPDENINYVAEIRAGEMVSADTVNSIDTALKETGRKYQLYGYDYHKRNWEPVSEGDHWYTSIKVIVQLVDRGGAVTQEQLEQIAALLRKQANEISAICELPEVDEAITKALALDDFCVEVDIIVGLSVAARPGQVLHGTQLRALAESSGLQLTPNGAFVMPDGHGGTMFTMDNQESNPFRADELKNLTTRSVTFLLDVPRTSDGIKVFNKMVNISKQFAESLDAVLCDDNRAMLNDSGLEKIRNQLRMTYESMNRRGIPAGSTTARQLFS